MCVCFRFFEMLFLLFTACLIAVTHAGCPMRPTVGQTSANRTEGDGGYRILISGETNGYIPNAIHIINLQGLISWKIIWKINKLEVKRYTIIAKIFISFNLKYCCYENTKFQVRKHTRDYNNSHVLRLRCALYIRRLFCTTSVISNCFRILWLPLTRIALTRFPNRPISRSRRCKTFLKRKINLLYFSVLIINLFIC